MIGDFSPSKLLQLRMKAELMWKDSQHAQSYTPQSEAAKAVLENQTARFEALKDRNKDHKIGVTWINACAVKAEDCESNCDIDEDELESEIKEYEVDICKKAGFSVDAEKMRTNDYNLEEVVSTGFASAIKVLDEFWAGQVLAKLALYAGGNAFPAPFTFDVATQTTQVPTAQYNIKLAANLLQQASLNQMGNPYFIDNGSLYLDWINAQLDGGNLDGKGDVSRIAQFKMYFDQFNFAKSGVTTDTFMISRGALAFQTKNRHPDMPTPIGGKVAQTVYTIPSISLPNVRYDVYYELKCKTVNGKAHYMHSWRLETQGMIALNPEGCPIPVLIDGVASTVTPSGVLAYKKV